MITTKYLHKITSKLYNNGQQLQYCKRGQATESVTEQYFLLQINAIRTNTKQIACRRKSYSTNLVNTFINAHNTHSSCLYVVSI